MDKIKKRGRKPKGGKIIQQITPINNNKETKPNVILHLKCSLKDLQSKLNLTTNIESFNFSAKNDLNYEIISSNIQNSCFADKNNKSLILKLLYNDYSFLFTGDIEQEAESVLSSTYKKKLHSQVLKVAHHGSKTSSTPEFLLYASPQISIISVGLNNRYHHPNQTIEKRLQHYGKTYRTDQLGAIEFTLTDKLTFKHYSN